MRSSKLISAKTNDCPTICICLGGFSPWNKVESIIAQLTLLNEEALRVILIKSFDTNFDEHKDSFQYPKNITFDYQENIDFVIQGILKIDLFIIGGGFLKFELLHLGEPFLIYPIVDHQSKLTKKFERLVGVDLEFHSVMEGISSVRDLQAFICDRRNYLGRFKNFFSADRFFSKLDF